VFASVWLGAMVSPHRQRCFVCGCVVDGGCGGWWQEKNKNRFSNSPHSSVASGKVDCHIWFTLIVTVFASVWLGAMVGPHRQQIKRESDGVFATDRRARASECRHKKHKNRKNVEWDGVGGAPRWHAPQRGQGRASGAASERGERRPPTHRSTPLKPRGAARMYISAASLFAVSSRSAKPQTLNTKP
jgi:hypothetical protein